LKIAIFITLLFFPFIKVWFFQELPHILSLLLPKLLKELLLVIL